jgi:uncharacterized membrane protein
MAVGVMIGLMDTVALVAGLLLTWFLFAKSTNMFAMALVFLFDRSEPRFMALYDLIDDEVSFQFMALEDIKTYADYLRRHRAARKTTYERFRRYFDTVMKVFLRTLLIAILPAVLFWSHWYWYLIGVAIMALGTVAYEYLIHNRRPGFYQRVMFETLLVTHPKVDQ